MSFHSNAREQPRRRIWQPKIPVHGRPNFDREMEGFLGDLLTRAMAAALVVALLSERPFDERAPAAALAAAADYRKLLILSERAVQAGELYRGSLSAERFSRLASLRPLVADITAIVNRIGKNCDLLESVLLPPAGRA